MSERSIDCLVNNMFVGSVKIQPLIFQIFYSGDPAFWGGISYLPDPSVVPPWSISGCATPTLSFVKRLPFHQKHCFHGMHNSDQLQSQQCTRLELSLVSF